jgi:Protein of unknown function (DUF5818)
MKSALMKSGIKRTLYVSISAALVALTLRRYNQDTEIEADPGEPDGGGPDSSCTLDRPSAPALPPGDQPARVSLHRPALVAPTVTFSGTVVRSGPRFALRETAGILYPLDSAGRAWPYEGEDVRVTGKLDLDTQLIYVDAIEHAVL